MRLHVRVQPRAGKTEVVGFKDGVLHLHVTEAPEKGRANSAVIDLLSHALRIPKSAIRVVRGETARAKVLDIDSLSEADVKARLAQA
jgi:uncharacterized protein (TIGR00251 family)